MIRTREGRVLRRLSSWPGAVELVIEVAGEGEFRGLAYPELVGTPDPGDTVLVNTTAVALGLGTGGYLLVIAILSRPAAPAEAGPGHLVKARYLPLQPVVLGLDEEASPHREAVLATSSLDGTPVVIADLHSALPAIVAGVRADRPDARVAYVMTDGGALPAWFSRTLAGLSAAEWLVGVVTAGQCFGGTLEAVTVHSGMLACRAVLHADVIVVTQGPGNLGTASPWSFTGVAAGEAVNAAHVLGGRPVASLRISGADPRGRHYGLSHHSRTSYGLVALAPGRRRRAGRPARRARFGRTHRAAFAGQPAPHRRRGHRGTDAGPARMPRPAHQHGPGARRGPGLLPRGGGGGPARGEAGQPTFLRSTTKTSVAFAGICGGAPAAP